MLGAVRPTKAGMIDSCAASRHGFEDADGHDRERLTIGVVLT